MKSLNDARYTMWATVIPKFVQEAPAGTVRGEYKRYQDPDSGDVSTIFVPEADQTSKLYPAAQYDIRCYARAYTALGYRSSANRESFVKGEYSVEEAIQFDFPAKVALNHQSLITNIRGHKDDTDYLWLSDDGNSPIVWEVQGVSPVVDPFGKLIRNTTVLIRAEVQ